MAKLQSDQKKDVLYRNNSMPSSGGVGWDGSISVAPTESNSMLTVLMALTLTRI